MSWISYFIPQIVARCSSPYNRDIRILEEQGKYKLLVNGSRQSGEYIRKLWQHAFVSFGIIPSPDIRSILVLGVGGGTVIHLTRAIYPEATIDAVDIDKQIIEIGKKYFSLSSVSGLSLIESDARRYVDSSVREKKHWDMIVVDVFIGPTIPSFVLEDAFLRKIKSILTPHGMLLINYLREREYKSLSNLLLDKLTRIFQSVRDTEIFFNRFFYAS